MPRKPDARRRGRVANPRDTLDMQSLTMRILDFVNEPYFDECLRIALSSYGREAAVDVPDHGRQGEDVPMEVDPSPSPPPPNQLALRERTSRGRNTSKDRTAARSGRVLPDAHETVGTPVEGSSTGSKQDRVAHPTFEAVRGYTVSAQGTDGTFRLGPAAGVAGPRSSDSPCVPHASPPSIVPASADLNPIRRVRRPSRGVDEETRDTGSSSENTFADIVRRLQGIDRIREQVESQRELLSSTTDLIGRLAADRVASAETLDRIVDEMREVTRVQASHMETLKQQSEAMRAMSEDIKTISETVATLWGALGRVLQVTMSST
ncbi:hypothetical protein PUNSTDRAFT_139407 [Punctularia strigosozonata HHB-11173 SS5]|uniref:Uncharacterized protein n=1 Tax=Punctularia strigosozonata (strain HHB-11173) TaxID=741275 RepID=R7S0Z7_PUNST|nr:uncharacterized protein PUNSTDRAFT_139407 [Punctularia strigosozonata HHB-11173 SS5]EIN03524.1 hypothetical protein PUNSTDRAFT_139407 [Punctularia strigosozonata HHB-11173 SS5]